MDVPYLEIPASEVLLEGRDCLVVDLRQAERFRMEHAKGAINLPVRDLWQHERAKLPGDKDLILLCEDGTDSMVACEILIARGFAPERLTSVSDGMLGWRKAGYPLEQG